MPKTYFFVCKKCHEWFWDDLKNCPDCMGELEKICPFCGNKKDKCFCNQEELKKSL